MGLHSLKELTDLFVKWSFHLGLLLIAVSVILCVVIVFIRLFLSCREKKKDRIMALWRPIFAESLYSPPKDLPPIKKSEQMSFIILWNHIQESLRGDSKEKLKLLAGKAQMNGFVKKLLKTRNDAKKLMAIIAIGHLGDQTNWKELRRIAKEEDSTVISLAAANALCKINSRFAAPVVISLILIRKDWPAYKIGAMLTEIGPEDISEPLIQSVIEADPEDQVRLIRLLRYCSHEKALPVIRMILEKKPYEQMIATCLHVLGYFADQRDLETIQSYLHHPLWYIRVQAVIAYGKIAGRDDEWYIIQKLTDKEWWVRYRAAQALASLPYMTRQHLEKIMDNQSDRFAKDILNQVIEENIA